MKKGGKARKGKKNIDRYKRIRKWMYGRKLKEDEATVNDIEHGMPMGRGRGEAGITFDRIFCDECNLLR